MSIIVLHHPNSHNNNTHIAIENSHGNNIKKLNFIFLYFKKLLTLVILIYCCAYIYVCQNAARKFI